MNRILSLILFMVAFAIGANVEPFVFNGVSDQQAQYEYMLQYKLYGYEYLKIGQNDTIPDKSGWNGSSTRIDINHQVVLGGPVLTGGPISVGNGNQLITGPIRGTSFSMGNDNNSIFAGTVCISNGVTDQIRNIVNRSGGEVTTSCPTVADPPIGLKMPTISFPDTTRQNVYVPDRGKVYIDIPDEETYDLYLNSITTGTEDTLFIRMANKGTLTRIFVKGSISFGNHTVVQVVNKTDSGDVVVSQDKFRGNLLFYTKEDFNIRNTDFSKLQGTYISEKKINLISNIDFAGQLLANELEIGDNFSGKNFRFVKFDPDTLDFPELNKQGGLRENDSTVIIPIELSDTSTIDVYFTYCFVVNKNIDSKDGVTTTDFNEPPYIPICGDKSITTKIPIGNKTPIDTIKVNIKKDTLTEPNEYLVMKIDSITGAVLPNGETSGELKIKIIDYDYKKYFGFDTTQVFVTCENYIGFVDTIRVINGSSELKYTLDSSATDRYTLDEKTGVLVLNEKLDFEKIQKDYIKVTVSDTGNLKKTEILSINILDVNEKPELYDVNFDLSENLPIPTIVGTLKATDPDQNSNFTQNQYELLTPSQIFQIDTKTGRITANKVFNYEKDEQKYELTVRVYDVTDETLADTAKVVINVANINERPSFGKDDTVFVIKENSLPGIVGQIEAKDDDGDVLTYKIIETVPFEVDDKGNISSTRTFDYEKEKQFIFNLVVTDGTLTDTCKVTVKIENINEPVHVKDTSFTIDENKTGLIGTVISEDEDGTIPEFYIKNNNNYNCTANGDITLLNPYNYEENKIDSLIVYVTDGEFTDSAKIYIKINDIPEDIILSGEIKPIEENVEIGTPTGYIIGKDGDSTDVTYTIDITEFKIDPVTGVITTNTLIDYETKTEYSVTVTAKSTDGSKKDTSFTIKIINVNEPVHINDTTFTVKENYTGPVGKVEGKDEDKEPVGYTIRDNPDYRIDSTGIITIVKELDFETKKFDTLIVDVSTPSGDRDSAIVIINVQNVNETPKLYPNDSLNVPENCKNCVVGVITAVDPDKDPITYKVIEPGFKIDSTGTLKVTQAFDYEKTPEIEVTIIAKDPYGASDTAKYKVKVTDVNEPVHTKDTTCTVKENYTGTVCKITGTDEDGKTPKFYVTDTTNYKIDSTGKLTIKKPLDYETKKKDTVNVIVTDGEFSDTAKVIIKVVDEPETVKIKTFDDEPAKDTIRTNKPDHTFDWDICEGTKCDTNKEYPKIHKDTTIKVCNTKKTSCDSVVVLFNDNPPVVTLTNANSTKTLIDYITIEEQKDDKIYVNKKENELTVTVKDTVNKTSKSFPVTVNLDTIHVSSKNLQDYPYILDVTKAEIIPIGGGLSEMVETIKDGNTYVTIKQIVDSKTLEPKDTVQTVSYTKKQDGKNITVTYLTDQLTGNRISNYYVSYNMDSCTSITYELNDKKKIVKNSEGNISYTVKYEYTDDYGNKAWSKVDIVFDNIVPKVEILEPYTNDVFYTNAIPVKWTVNGETQDTLTLQRLERGGNLIIRRYVDKAGNAGADTIYVMMKEAKDIEISIVNPVTKINQDKVVSFYSENKKFKKQYTVKVLKKDEEPDPVGIGFKVDIALPSISPTGALATLDDITKNGRIPVDEKGNIVGASNLGISVEEYINEHCTDDFRQDYHKNGTNIPLYNVKYNLHLWIYTSNANYVNDFEINYDIDYKTEANSAGIANFIIDWIPEKDGNVKAKNHHLLGTGAYLVKLYSKSTAIYRCGFKNQKAGDKITKKEYNLKSFGYKRPSK